MSNFKYEVERLNKAVTELRGKLFESEAENQKLKLELECVLELLKKAWAGDRIASMHITNILNNAEISNLKQHSGTSTTILDPSAARQAIIDKQQRETLLRSRNEYLNQEFIKTVTTMGTMPVSCNTSSTMSRPSSSVLRRPMSTGGRPGSARTLGFTRRAQSAVGGDRQMNGSVNVGERFEGMQASERLELFGLKPTNTSVRYDDPTRYLKEGLFNPKTSTTPDLKITGKQGAGFATVPFVYASQSLQPTGSPRVQAAQVIAARRMGRAVPVASMVPGPSRRPPSGVLAVQDRPLKNEVQYYESSLQPDRRPQSGRNRELPPSGAHSDSGETVSARSKSSRGIRFADDVELLPAQSESDLRDETQLLDSNRAHTPSDERKRRVTVAIQRRIGILDNAIVVPR